MAAPAMRVGGATAQASSGRRGGLHAGIGPLRQQPLHTLAASARVVKRRIKLQRLVEVSGRMVGIVLGFVGFAAGNVGLGIFWIEPDRLTARSKSEIARS
jgi:hypothetical protein